MKAHIGPSFDNLAAAYRFLERFAFHDRLHLARLHALEQLPIEPKHGLLIGDGDGRFCEEILKRYPNATIVSIDSSHEMQRLSRKRLEHSGLNTNKVTYIESDIQHSELPRRRYDFIALNFILDCFTQTEIDNLLPKIEMALIEGGFIAYSDFEYSKKSTLNSLLAKTVITSLYLFFRAVTEIQATRLPTVNWTSAQTVVSRKERLGGLIVSELRTQTT